MKKFQNSIIGILLIIVGTILGLNAFHITHINLFFEGWWTLFIIIPSLCRIFTERDKTASLIGLFIGVYLLLSCQGIISFHFLWKLFLPLVLIILGIQILFKILFLKIIHLLKQRILFQIKNTILIIKHMLVEIMMCLLVE